MKNLLFLSLTLTACAHQPLRFRDSPADYAQLGLTEPVAVAEDGRRTQAGSGEYEWWYLDGVAKDGTVVVVVFADNWLPGERMRKVMMDVVQLQLAQDAAPYRSRALEILHYFHGVNPLGMVYLTNMKRYGAAHSANEIFHTWYMPNTKWSDASTSECGPAPGYVPGGPNSSYSGGVSPPAHQPPQKSYKDWNAGSPENSWEVTEPAIYYQAAYVKLLSAAVR